MSRKKNINLTMSIVQGKPKKNEEKEGLVFRMLTTSKIGRPGALIAHGAFQATQELGLETEDEKSSEMQLTPRWMRLPKSKSKVFFLSISNPGRRKCIIVS